jgi:curved DNA-binding protein CbpA
MTATATNLDINGSLTNNPLAELLVEISQADLSGSIRLANRERKMVIYIQNGDLVHAVSNQREHRLFNIGLERKKFTKELLSKHPNFANDIEFAAALKKSGELSDKELNDLAIIQIEQIMIDSLSWTSGEWTYSPHSRLRADLVHEIDLQKLLLDFARCMPEKQIFDRFRSVSELFEKTASPANGLALQAHEKFVLEQFDFGKRSIADLRTQSAMPESAMTQAIYALWLGGLLSRHGWNSALKDSKVNAIRSAKLSKVHTASALPSDKPVPATQAETAEPVETENPAAPVVPELTLDEYLEQAEGSNTHYELLGVDDKSTIAVIKTHYFEYARNFHPDKYHRGDAEIHRRVQMAFTNLAHAYEILKTTESRETYDFKIRKELETQAKRRSEGKTEAVAPEEIQAEKGLESFESGLELYQDEEYAAAATHLARAVHYSPQNALYHAYFGKALSYTGDKYRHQAESELQAAVKIDPKNTKIRMMLVEFFTDMNMNKRAIGELNRFLTVEPGNRQAKLLLQNLTRESPE